MFNLTITLASLVLVGIATIITLNYATPLYKKTFYTTSSVELMSEAHQIASAISMYTMSGNVIDQSFTLQDDLVPTYLHKMPENWSVEGDSIVLDMKVNDNVDEYNKAQLICYESNIRLGFSFNYIENNQYLEKINNIPDMALPKCTLPDLSTHTPCCIN